MAEKRILVPLDGSKLAEAILPYAEAVARLTGAGIRLFTAAHPGSEESWFTSGEFGRNALHAHREAMQTYLASIAASLQERGREVEAQVAATEVVDSIVAAAGQADVSLVAMSTHGRGGAARFILGSVADKVLRLVTQPILLVRGTEDGEPRGSVEVRRILLPLDGSPLAETAIEPAVAIARAAGATLVLARAEPPLWESAIVIGNTPELSALDQEVTASVQQYLAELKSRLPAGTEVEIVVSRSHPAAALEDIALHRHIDLVVMATHGRGGFRRLLVGSMADRMVRIGAATLLIRVNDAIAAQADR